MSGIIRETARLILLAFLKFIKAQKYNFIYLICATFGISAFTLQIVGRTGEAIILIVLVYYIISLTLKYKKASEDEALHS